MPARSWHRAGWTAGKPGWPGGGAEMPERFTARARRVAVLAQDESRMPGHEHIGTGHILPCLIREDQGLAARALEPLGISSLEARASRSRRSPAGVSGHRPRPSPARQEEGLSLTGANAKFGTPSPVPDPVSVAGRAERQPARETNRLAAGPYPGRADQGLAK
jgi:hypothetical protein